MGLEAVAGLVVAVFELKAVRAVTRAFNANLPKDGPLGTIRPSSAQLYARPRRYYSPTALVRPSRVDRPVLPLSATTDRRKDDYDSCYRDRPVSACRDANDARVIDGPTRPATTSVIEPPWKHLPPVRECRTVVKVQRVRPKVEIVTKGTLLDVFV